ncbi:MAG: translational GTPase TypA, partial [Candidatus Peribacteraceae bacterium]|nr:translational GTPase TypA [Candidatus Peribacteraceae bacterium]
TDAYKVSGRGELHLSVLIEDMRREGFELQVSRPEVIEREENGQRLEPVEHAIIDVPEEFTGRVIEMIAGRKGEMLDMKTHEGHTRLEYKIPTRGLLGFRGDFIIETRGEGILTHSFLDYEPYKGELSGNSHGSMISMENGVAVAFALWSLQERGRLFIVPQTKVYVGMVIGESAKDEEMTVNPCKEKKLSNMRASGSDEAIVLTPVQPMTLEQALEYIADDELVEVTPESIRLRKKLLTDNDRRRARR